MIEIIEGIFVRRSGPRKATKIICLHGFSDSGLMFLPLFKSDALRDFELIAVDLPGFGASPRKAGVGTVHEFAETVAALANAISPKQSVALVGHSIASAIAVAAAGILPSRVLGILSIEGNLTEEDAYFSGRAADWDDPTEFKTHFLGDIWALAQGQQILRRYYGGVVMADPQAMWDLGRDAKRIGRDNAAGEAYRKLAIPNLYYWSRENTAKATQDYIASNKIAGLEFANASHWPTVDATDETARVISSFFKDA